MVFSKSFVWMWLGSMSILISFTCSSKFYHFSDVLQPLLGCQFSELELVLSLSSISMLFLVMVMTVTSLVLLFSEYYLDSYANKKFLSLTLLFFSFMSVLSLSNDMFLFMLGWDGLGISSLFLIMFYPNKVTMFNSFLTLFFNRLGDIFLILFFCLVLCNSSLFYNMSFELINIPFLVLFACLLTKSAQIPFSSWLPAAMSAPTPISAMVHSSTLVTAGILMFFKFFWYLHSMAAFSGLIFISAFTFLVGGILGFLEKDLKKVVAFSTMSQISMILFFLGMKCFSVALSHTFCHALFKTLLFCGCGLSFTWLFSDQNSKSFKSSSQHWSLFFLIMLSVFGMSGFIFSSAFYTKDAMLEFLLGDKFSIFFLILILGSFFTLMYSGSIFKASASQIKSNLMISSTKNFFFKFLIYFCFLSVICMKLWQDLLGDNFSFILASSMVVLISFVLFFLMFWPLFLGYKSALSLSLSVFHMKESSFSVFSKIGNGIFLEFTRSDQFMFKPSFKNINNLHSHFNSMKFLLYSLLSVLLLIS